MEGIDKRHQELKKWLSVELGLPRYTIAPASSDASFRQYFRVTYGDESLIVMDAPPEKESCESFIVVAKAFAKIGLNVPRILEHDLDRGYLLLTDLGERQYLAELNVDSVEGLYGDALDALYALQIGSRGGEDVLPTYDSSLLRREMDLFTEWFLGQYLKVNLGDEDWAILHETFEGLIHAAQEQPLVWVHRDYHSRNLMVCAGSNPGILDFQDAVVGPVTYDLVSLLRDCYVSWSRESVEQWVTEYYYRLVPALPLEGVNSSEFLRWFDLMGAQRHLKAIGIFARLNIRDGKPGYLRDIPRTMGYVSDVCGRYPEMAKLKGVLERKILPALSNKFKAGANINSHL